MRVMIAFIHLLWLLNMNRSDITKVLEKITQDIELISDEHVKSIQKTLLNLIEALLDDNEKLRVENQQLRDENNRLKGEQGKPNIRRQTQPKQDLSSEKERRHKNRNKKKAKKKKKNRMAVNRVETLDSLPNFIFAY
jgi:cell division protein FtsB